MKTSLATGLAIVLAAGIAGRAAADTPAASPAPAASAVPKPEKSEKPRREPPQLANIRIDFTLTDTRGSEPAVVKTSTVTLADQEVGRIRAEYEDRPVMGRPGLYYLNFDVRPAIQAGRVRLNVTVDYRPQTPDGAVDKGTGFRLKQETGTLLESGHPVVVAEATDPTSDRRITLEVKATILR